MYQSPGPQHGPYDPRFGPPGGAPPPRRSNGPILAVLAAAGAIVVALLAVVAVVVLRDDGDPAPVVADTNVFSTEYAGTWSSTVYQKRPTTASYVATVEIKAGSATGTVTYTNTPGDADGTWSCEGTLTFIKRIGGSGFKTVVREHLTTKTNAKCATFSYAVLFPKNDGTAIFLTTYVTQAAAEIDEDYYAIGTLEKRP